MDNFEWRTDEPEAAWNAPEAPRAKSPPGRRRWRLAVVVALLLIGFGGALAGQARRQVAAAEAQARADVLASHALVRQAWLRGDAELLQTLLSGRDPAWTAVQQAWIAAQSPLDRPALGLKYAAQVGEEPPQVTLDPDLRGATVTFTETYRLAEAPDGIVRLRQTAVYRRGAQQWLYAPPQPEFWGEWSSVSTRRLTVSYPARDAAVVQRLVVDLEELLQRACAPEELGCAPNWRALLRFEAMPDAWLAQGETTALLAAGRQVRLPAPTLVGLPPDEAGYRALRQGYGRALLTAVVAEQVGYRCCDGAVFFTAALDRIFADWDLQAWPPQVDFVSLLDEWPQPRTLEQSWNLAAEAQQVPLLRAQAAALVGFLADEWDGGIAALEMARRMAQHPTIFGWLLSRPPDGESVDLAHFESAWIAYTYGLTAAARQTPPAPWPAAALNLVCDGAGGAGSRIMRYDLQAGAWTADFAAEPEAAWHGWLTALPRAGLYTWRQVQFDEALQARGGITIIDQGEVQTALLRELGERTWAFFDADPTGRFLLGQQYVDGRSGGFALLDRLDCTEAGCPLTTLNSRPHWSPNGRLTLNEEIVSLRDVAVDGRFAAWRTGIFRGDAWGRKMVFLGSGGQPFWLDDAHYGFFRVEPDAAGQPALALALARVDDAGGDAPRRALWLPDLLALIPEEERPLSPACSWPLAERPYLAPATCLWPDQVSVAPLRPQRMLLTVSSTRGNKFAFLLDVDRAARQVTAVELVGTAGESTRFELSPDGRWLTAATSPRSVSQDTRLTLTDLDNGRALAFTTSGFDHRLAWSENGRWLALARRNQLLLLTPQNDYRRLIVHEMDRCVTPAWVGE